ncbi:MAG: Rrf2 family transcriptional regulator [Bacteroidota bacterium]|nr:Rrf2 family transcriptional regulator [Bacteroidota bacterium]
MSGIINLTRAASIGIHACVLISNSKDRLNVTQIADALKASSHHVAKVLQKLAAEGILHSSKGASGGFSMAINPSKINLLHIYEIIQGPIEESHCPEYSDICPFDECIWGDFGNQTRENFKSYLASRSLESVKVD